MKRGSFLPQGLRVVGDLEGKEDLLVAGSIEGDVELEGELTVTSSGLVRGEIRAAGVIVQGVVVGNVVAEHYVRIDAGGRVVGDVRAPRIHLVEGGLLRGRLQMTGEGRLPMPVLARSAPKEVRRPATPAHVETLAGQSSVGFVPAPELPRVAESSNSRVASAPQPKSVEVAPATIPPVVGPAAVALVAAANAPPVVDQTRHNRSESARNGMAPAIPKLGRAQARRRAEPGAGGQPQ